MDILTRGSAASTESGTGLQRSQENHALENDKDHVYEQGVQKGTSCELFVFLYSCFIDQPGLKISCTKTQTLPNWFLFALFVYEPDA